MQAFDDGARPMKDPALGVMADGGLSQDTGAVSLSVVVVAFVGDECLPRCLEHLMEDVGGRDSVEVLVACDDRVTTRPSLAARHPSVRWVHGGGEVHPAVLRSRAVASSRGARVALLEDHCVVAPGWCDAALRATAAIQGGPIDKAEPDTRLNWAGYFLEFAYFMPPLRRDEQRASDCNSTYSREALDSVRDVWAREFHETSVNWALHDRGHAIVRDAGLLVYESHPLHARAAIREKRDFGRTYARTRCARMPRGRQLAYAAASPVLPAILTTRMARIAVQRHRLGAFVRAYPWFLALALAWTAGEFAGYFRGATSLKG